MGSRFVRRVRTASGAVAVQIVTREAGVTVEIDHVGSAHTDVDLALLLEAARERLYPDQDAFDFGVVPQPAVSTDDIADWTQPAESLPLPSAAGGRPRAVTGGGRLVSTSALLLWDVLARAYSHLVEPLRVV